MKKKLGWVSGWVLPHLDVFILKSNCEEIVTKLLLTI